MLSANVTYSTKYEYHFDIQIYAKITKYLIQF